MMSIDTGTAALEDKKLVEEQVVGRTEQVGMLAVVLTFEAGSRAPTRLHLIRMLEWFSKSVEYHIDRITVVCQLKGHLKRFNWAIPSLSIS